MGCAFRSTKSFVIHIGSWPLTTKILRHVAIDPIKSLTSLGLFIISSACTSLLKRAERRAERNSHTLTGSVPPKSLFSECRNVHSIFPIDWKQLFFPIPLGRCRLSVLVIGSLSLDHCPEASSTAKGLRWGLSIWLPKCPAAGDNCSALLTSAPCTQPRGYLCLQASRAPLGTQHIHRTPSRQTVPAGYARPLKMFLVPSIETFDLMQTNQLLACPHLNPPNPHFVFVLFAISGDVLTSHRKGLDAFGWLKAFLNLHCKQRNDSTASSTSSNPKHTAIRIQEKKRVIV